MDTQTYTEKDLQDYAAGILSSDLILFEDFLKKNENAMAQVDYYKLLHQTLRNESIPGLSFDLANKVVSVINAQQLKETRKEILWEKLSFYSLGSIFLFALIIAMPSNFFVFLRDDSLWVGSTIILVFIYLFHYVEMSKTKKVLTRS